MRLSAFLSAVLRLWITFRHKIRHGNSTRQKLRIFCGHFQPFYAASLSYGAPCKAAVQGFCAITEKLLTLAPKQRSQRQKALAFWRCSVRIKYVLPATLS